MANYFPNHYQGERWTWLRYVASVCVRYILTFEGDPCSSFVLGFSTGFVVFFVLLYLLLFYSGFMNISQQKKPYYSRSLPFFQFIVIPPLLNQVLSIIPPYFHGKGNNYEKNILILIYVLFSLHILFGFLFFGIFWKDLHCMI